MQVYKRAMPNKRREGQTFIGCQVDEMLLSEIEGARGRKGRSQFVREAIAEKLSKMGFVVNDKMVFPPDRVSITTKVSGSKNVVKATFTSTSQSARASAKCPPKPRGKKKPEK
jgi:hypothetical protein